MPALLLFLVFGASAAAAQQIDTLALRAHTRFLSDDALAGRGTGSPGERIAALYIESQLRKLGAQPVAGEFQQAVPLKQAVITAARLRVRSAADSTEFGQSEFIVNTGGARSLRNFNGPALFVGTADHARALSAAAFRDRIIVVLGTLGADAATLVPAWIQAGAAGLVLLVPDSAQFQLFLRSRGVARYYVDAPLNEPIWQSALPTLIAGPKVTSALAPQISALLGLLSRATAPIELGRFLDVSLELNTRTLRAANVIGVIPGSDPNLRSEHVIFTAHYDHLGVSTPDARGDSIYNGFSDNAAGVAMLLAIAQEFAQRPLPRSVAFLFFTGEERGLLGSSYYAVRPLIPLDRTVAVINLDAGAPPAPPIEWRLAGGTASTIGAMARTVAAQRSWKLDLSDPTPNSDYWPFHTHGVPAVFLIPGAQWEGMTAAQRDALRARWDRYHRADDEWAEDFPFSGLQRYAEFAMEIGRAIGQSPERPRYLRIR